MSSSNGAWIPNCLGKSNPYHGPQTKGPPAYVPGGGCGYSVVILNTLANILTSYLHALDPTLIQRPIDALTRLFFISQSLGRVEHTFTFHAHDPLFFKNLPVAACMVLFPNPSPEDPLNVTSGHPLYKLLALPTQKDCCHTVQLLSSFLLQNPSVALPIFLCGPYLPQPQDSQILNQLHY